MDHLRKILLYALWTLLFALALPGRAVADVGLRFAEISSSAHVRGGDSAAKYTVVEYADFQCPYCRRGFQVVQALREKYGDNLRFVFKNNPLSIHPQAMSAAKWFEAVSLQSPEKAWLFHDKMFRYQEELGVDFFRSTVKELGLDVAKAEEDARSQAVTDKINADIEEAKKFGIMGTPAFLINGNLIAGAYPMDTFLAAIQAIDAGRPVVADAPPTAPSPAPTQVPAPANSGLSQADIQRMMEQAATKAAQQALSSQTARPDGQKAPEKTIRSDVDEPRHTLAEKHDDFAVVIGVEKYANDLPEAQFAERDARAVKDHLLALGVPERNIKLLTNSHASLSALAAYIEDWLPRNVKEDSRVFIYFSGHGAPDPESSQAYLVPSDGDPNFLDKTAYPVKKLYANLNKLKARRIVVALDSCFSGAGGRSVLAEGTRPLVTKIDTSLTTKGKILLFTATSPKEVTSTLKEQGHGLFTYYFLKGLDGDAENASGAITARSLYAYLKPRVQDAASRQNRDQTPLVEGDMDGDIVRLK